MSPRSEPKEEEEQELENDELSRSEDDDALDEDMEALRRACVLTGRNPNHINNHNNFSTSTAMGEYSTGAADSDSDDDLELVRNIQNRFSISPALCETLTLEPLSSLPPATSDDEDDFEMLLAIQRRFSAQATSKRYTYMSVCAFYGGELKNLNKLSGEFELHSVVDVGLWFWSYEVYTAHTSWHVHSFFLLCIIVYFSLLLSYSHIQLLFPA
jgi:hypothetical protein